ISQAYLGQSPDRVEESLGQAATLDPSNERIRGNLAVAREQRAILVGAVKQWRQRFTIAQPTAVLSARLEFPRAEKVEVLLGRLADRMGNELLIVPVR